MGSHSHSAVEDLHGFTRQVYVQFLVDQRVWHAVKVALDFDVVVDVDTRGFPFSERSIQFHHIWPHLLLEFSGLPIACCFQLGFPFFEI